MRLDGQFSDCHGGKERYTGSPHLNIAPDDFVRACGLHAPAPAAPETLAPIGTIVPAQLVVERLAARLDLDPDNPRGLAKVTQTEADSSSDDRA